MKIDEVLAKYQNHPDFDSVKLIEPNQRGLSGDSPINIAAQRGNLEDLEVLIAAGADVNSAGELGNTAMHEAAARGHRDIVRCLLKNGANSKARNELNQTPRDMAVLADQEEVIRLLDSDTGV